MNKLPVLYAIRDETGKWYSFKAGMQTYLDEHCFITDKDIAEYYRRGLCTICEFSIRFVIDSYGRTVLID